MHEEYKFNKKNNNHNDDDDEDNKNNGVCSSQNYKAKTYNKCSLVAEVGNRPFGHNRHGSKLGGLCPFWEGELGLHVTHCGLGRGLHSYQVPS